MKLRPHHLLCMNFFIGKGYSEQFVQNMYEVIDELKASPKMRITLVRSDDAVCRCCPKRLGGGCADGDKAIAYDDGVVAACGLEYGAEYEYGFLARAVAHEIIDRGLLSVVCRECEWLGICRSMVL